MHQNTKEIVPIGHESCEEVQVLSGNAKDIGTTLANEIHNALNIPQADLDKLESITLTVVIARLVPRKS